MNDAPCPCTSLPPAFFFSRNAVVKQERIEEPAHHAQGIDDKKGDRLPICAEVSNSLSARTVGMHSLLTVLLVIAIVRIKEVGEASGKNISSSLCAGAG